MKISENYDLREFISPMTYSKFGNNGIWFVNPLQVQFGEWLTSYLNKKAIVNNWHFFDEAPTAEAAKLADWYLEGHIYTHSGYREPACSEGAKESQHRCHNGNDWKVPGFEAETLRMIVRENYAVLNQRFGITTIEKDTPTWLHADNRWTMLDHLFEVNFKI